MLPSTFWLDFLALEKSGTIIYKAKKILRIILRLDFLYLDFYSYCGFAEPFGKNYFAFRSFNFVFQGLLWSKTPIRKSFS